MRYTTAFILASASFAAAQSTTPAATGSASSAPCGQQIQTIISTCLSTQQIQVNGCTGNDWDCLCSAYTNVLTCYNNCPSDPNRFGVSQQQVQYCNAAKTYGTAAAQSASSAASAAAASASASSGSASSNSSTASTTGAVAGAASGTASGTQTTLTTTATSSRASSSAASGSATSTRASGTASAAASTGGASGMVVAPLGGLVALAAGVLGLL